MSKQDVEYFLNSLGLPNSTTEVFMLNTPDNQDQTSKLTNWKNPPTVAELKQDYQLAKTNHSAVVTQIDKFLDNLHIRGSAKIKSRDKNRSSVQPKLIRKQAEWRYAPLSEPFLSAENIFKVFPTTWEDADSAEENQLVLNHQFNNQIKKVKFIDDYVRNCVNEGTVIVRTGWTYKEVPVTKQVPEYSYIPCPEEYMQQLMDAAQVVLSDPSQKELLPDAIQKSIDATVENERPIWAVQTGVVEVKTTEVVLNQPELTVCDYQDVLPDPLCKGDIDKANFVIYRFETSIAELAKTGLYSNLDLITKGDKNSIAQADEAFQNATYLSQNFSDNNRQKFTAYEYWGLWDINGDGILKPIVATWVNNTCIRMEENPYPDQRLPFVFVSYLPTKNSLYGEPDGALLEENQSIIGAVTRGMIDLMARSANGQKGVRKDALDVVNKRKFLNGEDYEINGNIADPSSIVYTHQFAEIPQSAPFMIDYQNNEAEGLTGVKAFSGGLSGESLGDVAAGVRSVLDAASKREMGILRRLSAGLIEIGQRILAMNAEFLSEEEVIRITNNQFKTVRRDSLKGRYDIKLEISTAETDNAKAQELAFMLQTMGNTLPAPVTTTLLAEIAKLRKMPHVAHAITNWKPEPDPYDQKMRQLAEEQAILKNELIRAQIQATLTGANLDMSRAELAGAQTGLVQSQVDQNNLDFVEQESGVKQERDLQRIGHQAESQAKLAVLQNVLNTHPRKSL